MQQKIFIGIDLDSHLKKSITRTLKKLPGLPVRWHAEDSYHVALVPIGWVSEDDALEISEKIADLCTQTQSFSVSFEEIVAFAKDPHDTDPRNAQLIRLIGTASQELRDLYQDIAEALELPISTKKEFRPFVDLGKIRAKMWQELENIPQIDIPFPLQMDVATVTIFEAIQIDGKREFVPIEVYELS